MSPGHQLYQYDPTGMVPCHGQQCTLAVNNTTKGPVNNGQGPPRASSQYRIYLRNPPTHKILFAQNLFHSCQIISKFCTEHGSDTVMPYVKCRNDWATHMDIMDEWDFTRVEFFKIFRDSEFQRNPVLQQSFCSSHNALTNNNCHGHLSCQRIKLLVFRESSYIKPFCCRPLMD